MSWLFSRALVVDCLGENFSDGEQSAQLSGESTPLAYCAPDRMKGFSRLSRFGVTFKPLTDDLGADVLTSYLEAFPAKTLALQEKAQELTVSGLACGATWLGSLGKYDPASRSWKTAQRSFLGDLEESLVIWPRSGMTAAGECWELPMLEPITSGTGSGLWVPTPTASGFDVQDVPALLARRERCKERNNNGNGFGLTLNQWVKVQAWPTPNARDYKGAPGAGCQARGGHQSSLPAAVKMLLTPNTSGLDGGSNSRRAQVKRGDEIPSGGSLNPTWVEWLMGWPLGWTDLKPSVTDKSHSVPLQHGECLEGQ